MCQGCIELEYKLTGNFQYDIGVFGLKKVLESASDEMLRDKDNDFRIVYNCDQYSIKITAVPNDPDKPVRRKDFEDKLARVILLSLLNLKRQNDEEKSKKGKNVKSNQTKDSDKENKKCKDQDCLDAVDAAKMVDKYMLNFFNPIRYGQFKCIEDLISHIDQEFSKEESTYQCSFCGSERQVVPINRRLFVLAPSSMNSFYNNDPSIFICKDCFLAVLSSAMVLKYNSVFVYIANIDRMEDWYRIILDIEEANKNKRNKNGEDESNKRDEGEDKYKDVFQKIVSTLKNSNDYYTQIIEYRIDSTNPYIYIIPITKPAVEKMKIASDVLDKLLKRNMRLVVNSKKVGGSINLLREIIFYLSANQSLFTMIQLYLPFLFKMYKEGSKYAQYYAQTFLMILEMHLLITSEEVESMETAQEIFKEAKDYGVKVHRYIWGTRKEYKTALNYSIGLASSLLQSMHLPFPQALEVLIRVSVTTGKPLPSYIRDNINENNYKEVMSAIALSIMSMNEKTEDKADDSQGSESRDSLQDDESQENDEFQDSDEDEYYED